MGLSALVRNAVREYGSGAHGFARRMAVAAFFDW